MDAECTYCGSDVYDHRPVYVTEQVDGDRERVGQFCGYACLSVYIDEQDLVTGSASRID